MSGQQNNPLSLFMILGLLALAPPETINKNLESLSVALNATSKSVDSLKKGMDTFHTGLQQLSQPVTGKNNNQHNNSSKAAEREHETGASIMPADAPGWDGENKKKTHSNPPEDSLNGNDTIVGKNQNDYPSTSKEENGTENN